MTVTTTPPVAKARPPVMSASSPVRCRNAPPRSAVGNVPTAAAATKSPASSGLNPATCWNRCVVTSWMPPIANIANDAASTPAVNAGLPKMENSNRGCSIPR